MRFRLSSALKGNSRGSVEIAILHRTGDSVLSPHSAAFHSTTSSRMQARQSCCRRRGRSHGSGGPSAIKILKCGATHGPAGLIGRAQESTCSTLDLSPFDASPATEAAR